MCFTFKEETHIFLLHPYFSLLTANFVANIPNLKGHNTCLVLMRQKCCRNVNIMSCMLWNILFVSEKGLNPRLKHLLAHVDNPFKNCRNKSLV